MASVSSDDEESLKQDDGESLKPDDGDYANESFELDENDEEEIKETNVVQNETKASKETQSDDIKPNKKESLGDLPPLRNKLSSLGDLPPLRSKSSSLGDLPPLKSSGSSLNDLPSFTTPSAFDYATNYDDVDDDVSFSDADDIDDILNGLDDFDAKHKVDTKQKTKKLF